MASGRDAGVRVEGLRALRRDLKRLSPEVDKQLRDDFRQIGERVAAEARAGAVRRTGEYAASIRPYVAVKGVSVGSPLPQAGVLHFGGTIRPRGTDIQFQARPVISDAVERQANGIVDMVGDSIEDAARAAGWKR